MRTDVKLGVVISLGVVLLAGGYYVMRDRQEKPIEVADKSLAEAAEKKDSAAAPRVERSSRAQTPSRSARHPGRSAGPDRPASRDAPTNQRTASREKPTGNESQPGVRQHIPGTSATQSARRDSSDETEDKTVSPAAQRALDRRMAAARRRANRMNQQSESPEADKGEDAARTAPQRVDQSPPDATNKSDDKAPAVKTANAQPNGADKGEMERRAAPQRITRDARGDDARRASSSSVTSAVETHRVQPGETFASLAKMYYGDEKYTGFLASSNQGVDPRTLNVGTEVKIPPMPRDGDVGDAGARVADSRQTSVRRASDSPATQRGSRTYTVRAGDTFYGIARDQLKDASRWRELFEMNKALVKGDATRLQVGQVIALPTQ